ncbi:MAG: hypothetical protein MUE60_15145 [Candidatus Eisenbacteria bacterium]|nr:hypothetical protein [Candidatus Eisenbacteria bacterium]
MKRILATVLMLWASAAGAVQICWVNPSRLTDGAVLTDLTEVMFYWSAQPKPSTCTALAQCSSWPTGNFLRQTDQEGAQVCADVPLPPGTNYVAATARRGTGEVSAFSNSVTRVVEAVPNAPVVMLDPACPTCTTSSARTMLGYTAQPITLRWEPSQSRIEIEVRKYPVVAGSTGTRVATGSVAAGQGSWVWTPTRPGLYYASARSCNATGCTAWTTPAQQPWIIYVELPPASGGGIE